MPQHFINALRKNTLLKIPSRIVDFQRFFSVVKPLSSTSPDKMAKDERYKAEGEVPEQVLSTMHANQIHSPGFSIKGSKLESIPEKFVNALSGEALEGRPAYLDFQATTPLDPRVLDAMVKYSYANIT